ncbi:MAG: tetratricopeptide repeat protein [Cyclobacteriaceae bacterium]
MKRTLNTLSILIVIFGTQACKEDSTIQNPDRMIDFNTKAYSFIGINHDSVVYYAKENLSMNLGNHANFYSYLSLGYSYQSQKSYNVAFNNFLKARDLVPEGDTYNKYRSAIFNQLAKIGDMYANYDPAIENYKQAIQFASDEEKAIVYRNLGSAYKKNNQPEEATEAYLKAKEIALAKQNVVQQAKTHHQLGLLFTELEDYNTARSYYETIVNYEGEQSSQYKRYKGKAYHNIGSSYLYQKDYTSAIPYFEKALTLKVGKDKFISHMDLASCLAALGEKKAADKNFKKAELLYAKVEPYEDNINLFKKMHLFYRENQQHDESNGAIDQYFAEIESFTATKQHQLNSYTAASLQARVDSHNKDLQMKDLIYEYSFYLVLSGIVLLLLLLISIRLFKSFKKERARRKEFLTMKDLSISKIEQMISELLS